ncbi:MAG: hypothetical protein Q8O76_02045 [Chloroflexota bacterium]|nr:hypothetical protein [Chloroflexota bacterium]
MTQANGQSQGLKVVLEEMGVGVAVGVQAKGCDPILTMLAGASLEEALARVPELVAVARERWAQSPKMPTYQRPPEAAKPATPASSTPRATTPAASKPKQPEVVRPQLM